MNRLFILITFIALFFSCNSSDDEQLLQLETDNFYALTVGNSWVYKNYKYDMNTQTYFDTGVIDSLSIVGTEIVNGNTYYKFRRYTTGNELNITYCNANGEYFELLRDSLGYFVRSDGNIKFTNSDFNERLLTSNNGVTIYETLMTNEVEQIVEAGTFQCVFSERYARDDSNNQQLPGLDTFFYSEGIGLIYDTSSFVTQDIPSIIRRLDSYSIQ